MRHPATDIAGRPAACRPPSRAWFTWRLYATLVVASCARPSPECTDENAVDPTSVVILVVAAVVVAAVLVALLVSGGRGRQRRR